MVEPTISPFITEAQAFFQLLGRLGLVLTDSKASCIDPTTPLKQASALLDVTGQTTVQEQDESPSFITSWLKEELKKLFSSLEPVSHRQAMHSKYPRLFL